MGQTPSNETLAAYNKMLNEVIPRMLREYPTATAYLEVGSIAEVSVLRKYFVEEWVERNGFQFQFKKMVLRNKKRSLHLAWRQE